MTSSVSSPPADASHPAFILLLLAAGLLLRLRLAWLTFLNPDEALHFLIGHQPSLALTYQASLTTAHPPLMFLLLHYWIRLGDSEFMLRLAFVIAGSLFCWVMSRWVERIAGRNAGCITLALLLLSPPLISLSAQIRQYSLLLLFCAASLNFLDRAFEERSAKWMALSMVALYLALLTHYSALIFAAAAGLYGLRRLLRGKLPAPLNAAWVAGQAGSLAILGFLFFSQILPLRKSGVPSEIASTWLRTSIFHPGEDHAAAFAISKTVRLFRSFFSHGTIGVFALGLFLFATALPLWQKEAQQRKPSPGELSILFASPFLIALAASLAGVYPYGGTRHDVVLVLFAMPAVAMGFNHLGGKWLKASWSWAQPLILAIGLVTCNVFSSPTDPYISPKNQDKQRMAAAMDFLNSAPKGSVLLTALPGSSVLNYYLCGRGGDVPFQTTPALLQSRCGNFILITSAATQHQFERASFPEALDRAWQMTPAEKPLWLFQAGWFDDKQESWIAELGSLGCRDPHRFGANILICPFTKLGPQP